MFITPICFFIHNFTFETFVCMKNKIIYLFFVLLTMLFLHPLSMAAQKTISSKYSFTALTIDNGLPVNFVDDIYKDSRGFLWFATQGGGLSRFDGYEFINFNVNSFYLPLKSNCIRKICEDKFKRLWVASDYGIDVINLKTMLRDDVTSRDKAFALLLQNDFQSVVCDKSGNIWIMSNAAIYKIIFNEKGEIERIVQTKQRNPKEKNSFSVIVEIQGEILTARDGMIEKVNETAGGYLKETRFSDKLVFGKGLFISSIVETMNELWIGTENGLFRFATQTKKLERYAYNEFNQNSISQDMITSLEVIDNGILVVGTLKGLNLFDLNNNYIERISHYLNASQLNNDFVNCLLADGNNLWVGTEAGGINKFTLRRLSLTNYAHNEKPQSLSPNPVNSIIEDHQGNLWVGTVEGGLNLKMKGETGFMHIRAGKNSISHNSVSALEEDNDNKLWVGTWGGGISVLDLNMPDLKSFTYLPSFMDYIAVLRYDKKNEGIWIGTNRQIYFYDKEHKSIHTPIKSNLTNNLMGTLGCVIDNNNRLWIGTSKGLIVADLNTFNKKNFSCEAHFFVSGTKNPSQPFLKNITSIFQSEDNSIWISSNGYGVCQIKSVEKNFECRVFSESDGLCNNSCYSLVEDDKNKIWIGTGNGLSCFNPKTGQFINYSKNDGLNNVQFYWNAGYKSPSTNKLYFGNISGLIEINGMTKGLKEVTDRVVFTKLQVLNKTVNAVKDSYAKQDITCAKELSLHESDKSFVIEFSALDFDNPASVNYSYRLLGFDDQWINVAPDKRFVGYTNLGSGTYHLQVKSTNASGEWSDHVADLKIVIHPYFYKTYWFIALLIFFLAGCVIQFYRWRVRDFKKQKVILHRKVEERTSKLEQQTIILEEQAQELKSQNVRLSEQNDKILHQQNLLVEMSKKVQDALTDRISFFTNITHEFRTPITLIVGPIERALKLSTNPKVIEQLRFVSRNSKNLLSLVNQLMDFQKVESDAIHIDAKLDNLTNYMDETLLPFFAFASERSVNLQKRFRLKSSMACFDTDALRKLTTNLLSNAIKFTQPGGTVKLYLADLWSHKQSQSFLYICVSDSGIGINKNELETIFDMFYQSKEHDHLSIRGQSGTGIGLYLCRRIVELMDGTIIAKINQAGGSSFRVMIPMEFGENSSGSDEDVVAVAESEDPGQQNSSISEGQRRLSVLIVEDNNDMRQYLHSILIDHYLTLEASDGKEALAILKSRHVDFIISDLMMPVMDGAELSKKVKSDFSISHIPILLLTAKTGKQTQLSGYRMGVDEILFKPFDEEILLARIQNIVETRQNYQRQFGLNMNIESLNMEKETDDERFVKTIIDSLQANYGNSEYDVSELIRSVGMSKTLLHNKMQTLIGQPPGNFIRNFRLNKAYELLSASGKYKTVAEVAYEVGFNDPKYFTRCFTKHFGVTPSSLENTTLSE